MNLRSIRPTASFVISCIALFVAMSGTAVALKGKNTVDSGDIKPGSVHTSDIATSAVGAQQIGRHQVVTGNLADNVVTADKLDVSAVPSASIQDGAVTGSKLNTILVSSIAQLLSPTPSGLSVNCPNGSRLISGGAETAGSNSVLMSSYPNVDDTGTGQGQDTQTWTAQGYVNPVNGNPGSQIGSMRVYALCLNDG